MPSNVRLGDTVPDFSADTNEGPINFHEWLGGSWGVLFSHPADYTPVCTTELGRMQQLHPEFEKRGCKIAALSIDGAQSQIRFRARPVPALARQRKRLPCRGASHTNAGNESQVESQVVTQVITQVDAALKQTSQFSCNHSFKYARTLF
jgi:hypothetical protein